MVYTQVQFGLSHKQNQTKPIHLGVSNQTQTKCLACFGLYGLRHFALALKNNNR